MMKYHIFDLVDIPSFQKVLDSISKITDLPCALLDEENSILASSGWLNICTQYHRACPESERGCVKSNTQLNEELKEGSFAGLQCENGLWDYAAPVFIDGDHIATIYTGQFLHEPPDQDYFRRQARKFGFDEESYIESLSKVPIIPRDKVISLMDFFMNQAKHLAVQGLERKRSLEALSERDRAEKARDEMNAFYQQVVEKINTVVYTFPVKGTSSKRYISPQIERMCGYLPQEWESNEEFWSSIVHPEDRERVEYEDRRVIESEEPFDVEYRIFKKDGSILWIHDQAVLVRDDKGLPLGWWGTIDDITQRKKDEEAKWLNEARLESLIKLGQMTSASEKEITDFALDEAIKLTGSTIGYIAYTNEDESILTMYSWSEEAMAECKIDDKPIVYKTIETGLWGEAIRQRKPVITNNYNEYNPYKKGYPGGHVPLTRHMNVPIFDGDHIVAVAGVGNKTEDYTESDVLQLTLMMSGIWSIIQRQRSEEALRQRILALTQPAGDLSAIKFEELFNIEEIQAIQDAFSDATGVASIITDVNGRPITLPSNFCYLCAGIIRKTEKGLLNCMYSDAELGKVKPDGPIIQPCLSGGLWDGGTSICVGEHHIANWLIGQVLDDTQSEEKMLAYGKEIGADMEQYRAALAKVPHMSRQQFEKVSQALFLVAKQLSTLARQNVQQARFITERQKAEDSLAQERTLLRTLINNLPDAVYVKDVAGRKTLANLADLENMGIQNEADVLGKTDFELLDRDVAEKTYADDMRVIENGESLLNREEEIVDLKGGRR